MVTAPASAFQGTDDLYAAGIRDRVDALDTLLRDVIENRLPVLDRDVRLGDRGQAEVAIFFLVNLAADPEHPDIEQTHRAGQHPPPVEVASSAHRAKHALAHRWQGPGESEHVLELRLGLLLTPQLVVAVLATAGRVHAGGLEVTERVRADPNIPPRRRNRQRSNPRDSGRVYQRSSVDVEVDEPNVGGDPDDSGKRRVGSVKPLRAVGGRVFSHNP